MYLCKNGSEMWNHQHSQFFFHQCLFLKKKTLTKQNWFVNLHLHLHDNITFWTNLDLVTHCAMKKDRTEEGGMKIVVRIEQFFVDSDKLIFFSECVCEDEFNISLRTNSRLFWSIRYWCRIRASCFGRSP